MNDNQGHQCLRHYGIVATSPMIGGGFASLPDLIAADRVGQGGWKAWLPAFQTQRKFGLDTMNCVQCSRAMVCNTLSRFWGRAVDLSERLWYWLTGCTEKGNSYAACDYGVRQGGGVRDARWAWDVPMSRAEYGKQPPPEIVAEAKGLLDEWTFGQLAYVPNTVADLRAALVKGPVWFCNLGHSMMLYDVDDRLRVWDTEANDTQGFGSFPLEYVTQIVAAYVAPFTPKNAPPAPNPMPTPNIVLPDNCYVTVNFPNRQEQWLHLGGKMIKDPNDPMYPLKQWVARNEDQQTHRFNGGPTRTIGEVDFNSFPHVNSKGEPI